MGVNFTFSFFREVVGAAVSSQEIILDAGLSRQIAAEFSLVLSCVGRLSSFLPFATSPIIGRKNLSEGRLVRQPRTW